MLLTALDAGVSPETLRKIESGRIATPAFPTIAAIADVLGLSLDAVWSEINTSDGSAGIPGRRAPRANGWRPSALFGTACRQGRTANAVRNRMICGLSLRCRQSASHDR